MNVLEVFIDFYELLPFGRSHWVGGHVGFSMSYGIIWWKTVFFIQVGGDGAFLRENAKKMAFVISSK